PLMEPGTYAVDPLPTGPPWRVWDEVGEDLAAKLAYSERTVKNVMHGLTTRLHLRNRAHAVAYALREGYI
ncbi:hypothetical protein ACWCO4_36290, partial [Streptomyces virginiae]